MPKAPATRCQHSTTHSSHPASQVYQRVLPTNLTSHSCEIWNSCPHCVPHYCFRCYWSLGWEKWRKNDRKREKRTRHEIHGDVQYPQVIERGLSFSRRKANENLITRLNLLDFGKMKIIEHWFIVLKDFRAEKLYRRWQKDDANFKDIYSLSKTIWVDWVIWCTQIDRFYSILLYNIANFLT